MKAEVYPSPDGWRFRVRGGNNEIMAVGEAYVRRIDAESALRTLFTDGPVEVVVRNHHTRVVDHYFLRGAVDTLAESPMDETGVDVDAWEEGEDV